MQKSEKEIIISAIQDKVSRAQGMFFTDFSGITVEKISELRREFRKSGVDYIVVKNTFVRKALEKVGGYDGVYKNLVGPTGIAFSYDDPVAPAKIIQKFQEQNEKLSCKACVLDKQIYDGKKLKELAQIPSRAEIVASVLGSLQSPISGIVGSINAVMRDVVGVLDAIEKKKAA